MTKITFIGAGSTMFARNLLCDIFSFPELREITVMLEDPNEQRLDMTYRLATRLVEQEGYPAKIERTTNQREALKDSDFVIVMFQIGGLEAYDIDKKIPLKYGIDQTVGDTLGPGGTFRGIRSIPVLIDICRDMEKVCPNALLLNYANPMASMMWAVNKRQKFRVSVYVTRYRQQLDRLRDTSVQVRGKTTHLRRRNGKYFFTLPYLKASTFPLPE